MQTIASTGRQANRQPNRSRCMLQLLLCTLASNCDRHIGTPHLRRSAARRCRQRPSDDQRLGSKLNNELVDQSLLWLEWSDDFTLERPVLQNASDQPNDRSVDQLR